MYVPIPDCPFNRQPFGIYLFPSHCWMSPLISFRIQDPSGAEGNFNVATTHCQDFAFVHIAHAQFELSQGREMYNYLCFEWHRWFMHTGNTIWVIYSTLAKWFYQLFHIHPIQSSYWISNMLLISCQWWMHQSNLWNSHSGTPYCCRKVLLVSSQ